MGATPCFAGRAGARPRAAARRRAGRDSHEKHTAPPIARRGAECDARVGEYDYDPGLY
ncbi:hypothetical protein OPKNFCMD_1083 [Methylobacterium crusticola]|uniref:Uncharacterized protein n=1 Tax=Methylobacterium crusticola TaxID=1697972 RepID=A0ABQ4QTZ4_9HYPH|nr:hypothetical protein [Methylobacterium crusticola]GJD48365.1 hypothetical protein OPKNFCMD_1083 [Methylobacterium crusticola]